MLRRFQAGASILLHFPIRFLAQVVDDETLLDRDFASRSQKQQVVEDPGFRALPCVTSCTTRFLKVVGDFLRRF